MHVCSHPAADCSYEVVLKNKDSKGQLMSLQQTLRQEIHAKIGAQSAEESAKRKVRCTTWAGQCSTWLLIDMTLEGVVFSVFSMLHLPYTGLMGRPFVSSRTCQLQESCIFQFLHHSSQLSCNQGCKQSCTTWVSMSGLR